MQFDFRALPKAARYKLLGSTVTPRPIAWVSTVSADGAPNAAPYSFFNAMGDDPPIVTLGLMKHHVHAGRKDTAANIIATGEFVVNLVSESDAEAMNLCSVDAPPDVDEFLYAGVRTAPSVVVKPPRIASSPVSLECRLLEALDYPGQTLVVGEVVMMHIADAFISDPQQLHLDTPAMRLIGRTHGRGWYVRTTDQFQMDRAVFDPARLDEEAAASPDRASRRR